MKTIPIQRLLVGAVLMLIVLPLLSNAQPSATNLADKSFSSQDIVRALAPRPEQATTKRTRGLGVVPVGPTASAADPVRRSVSMQLQFEFDSARLTSDAIERLNVVGIALQSPELSGGKFLITGHTDATGRYEYNLVLSKQRAEAVREYLVARHGVEMGRLITVGKASDELMDPAKADSAVNRRVQLDALN